VLRRIANRFGSTSFLTFIAAAIRLYQSDAVRVAAICARMEQLHPHEHFVTVYQFTPKWCRPTSSLFHISGPRAISCLIPNSSLSSMRRDGGCVRAVG
jgi:hypothetical protein